MFIIYIIFLFNALLYKALGFCMLLYYYIFGLSACGIRIIFKHSMFRKKSNRKSRYYLYKLSRHYIYTWKPIFKKNMYLGYLSELIVWKN